MCKVLITLTDARPILGRIIRLARITGEPVTITEYGEPVAVITPVAPVIPEQRHSPEGEE